MTTACGLSSATGRTIANVVADADAEAKNVAGEDERLVIRTPGGLITREIP
jgi:hypothetical protein